LAQQTWLVPTFGALTTYLSCRDENPTRPDRQALVPDHHSSHRQSLASILVPFPSPGIPVLSSEEHPHTIARDAVCLVLTYSISHQSIRGQHHDLTNAKESWDQAINGWHCFHLSDATILVFLTKCICNLHGYGSVDKLLLLKDSSMARPYMLDAFCGG
jgi:hypothetical protein